MGALPFSISNDAAEWIVEKLQQGREPETAGLLPALFFALGYQSTDKKGRLKEAYSEPFFDIGWYRPLTIRDYGGIEISIRGKKLFVLPDTLERLEDKQLRLEEVEVGFPTPSNKKGQFLRTVPKKPRRKKRPIR
jgi:hypothetical protein